MTRRKLIPTSCVLSGALLITLMATAVATAGEKRLEPLGPVPIPADNPQTADKIELGRMLYFDPRLSGDSSMSCAKCHDPAKGWSNNLQLSDSYPGTKHWRHVPTVLNSAYLEQLFWDGRAHTLEEQAVGPIAAPFEMNQNYVHLVEKLQAIPYYRTMFKKVFNSDVNMDNLAKAIASFERTIVSKPGRVDAYLKGDKTALNPSEIRGMAVFTGKANCIASGCMAWRWVEPPGPRHPDMPERDERGYCGLAGNPDMIAEGK